MDSYLDKIKKLEYENEKLKSLFSVQLDVMEQNNNMTTEIHQLKSKLKIAVDALEFYADKNKWNTMYYVKDCFAAIGPDDLTGNHFNINDKSYGGKTARQALSEIGGEI